MKLIKIMFIIIGLISLLLGTIGIFLPILPTVPFYLLSTFCFAKGSKRFHIWFINTNLYKKHLKEFDENKTMSLKKKIIILLFSSSMMLFPIIRLENIFIKFSLICLELFKYYYFIFKIKTK